jgi:hypothetical protein
MQKAQLATTSKFVQDLKTKLAEAQKDAARYRWLRTACDDQIPREYDWWGQLGNALAEDFDAAIDAAMVCQVM